MGGWEILHATPIEGTLDDMASIAIAERSSWPAIAIVITVGNLRTAAPAFTNATIDEGMRGAGSGRGGSDDDRYRGRCTA